MFTTGFCSLDAAHRVTGLSWAIEVNHQVTNERVVHIEPNSERRDVAVQLHINGRRSPFQIFIGNGHRQTFRVHFKDQVIFGIGLRKLLCGLFAGLLAFTRFFLPFRWNQ